MWLEFENALHPPVEMQRLQRNITTAKRCMEYCNGNSFGDRNMIIRTRNIYRFNGEINMEEFEDEAAMREDQEAMIASVQPDNQEQPANPDTNPVVSRLDRRRLKAAFYIADGEINQQEIKKKSGLSVPSIKNMMLIYNSFGIFYQGNNKNKYQSSEL